MYDCSVNGIDIGVPDLSKSSGDKFTDINALLFDIYTFPSAYVGFPRVPELFQDDGSFSENISIVKKGKSFFIIDRGEKGGRFIETLKAFSDMEILFSFTVFDFPDTERLDFKKEPRALKNEDLVNMYVFNILSQK